MVVEIDFDWIVLVCSGWRWSYGLLWQVVQGVVVVIICSGCEFVVLLDESSEVMVIVFFGVVLVGVFYVLLNYCLVDEDLVVLLNWIVFVCVIGDVECI